VTVKEISVQELHDIGPAARIIDVREPHEWAAGHIPHAELIVLATVPEHVDAFDGSPTYVICHAGGRSAHACEFLGAQGRDVVNVAGGMLAWGAAGYEIDTGTHDTGTHDTGTHDTGG
jgi:rhodanese-related sulfurtransferase